MTRRSAAVRGVLFAGLVSLACQRPAQGELRDGCPGCTWQRLGLHPQAAQPTATGRALLTLCRWRGRLYIGYGDYQDNTGPIAVTAWDPARNAFVTVHTSDTEAIYNFRPIGDALYAPATDRRTHADYAVGEPWRDARPVTVAHAYDMATLDGSDLWLVGSAEGGLYPPTAWRSSDGGAHWAIAHQRTENGRYYFAAVFDHRLYLESSSRAPRAASEVFDGERWSAGPELLPPFHISRLVRASVGEAPSAFRRRRLLERAAWQLGRGASVTEASLEAGHDAVEVFARLLPGPTACRRAGSTTGRTTHGSPLPTPFTVERCQQRHVQHDHGESVALNATDFRRDLGRSRGSPVTSRSKCTRLTLAACSQSGAQEEAPFGIYIPGSRRKARGLVCHSRHLGSTAPAAPTAPITPISASSRPAEPAHLRSASFACWARPCARYVGPEVVVPGTAKHGNVLRCVEFD